MGSISAMITMLKNNKLIKKKVLHFKNKKTAKYKSTKLTFNKGSKEDIERIRLKIKKQQRHILMRKIIILLISISTVIIILFYIRGKLN